MPQIRSSPLHPWDPRIIRGSLRSDELERATHPNRASAHGMRPWLRMQIRILHLQSLRRRGGVEFVVGGNNSERRLKLLGKRAHFQR